MRNITKKLMLAIVVVLFFSVPKVFAVSNQEQINVQSESFGISDFIKKSKEYTGDFFDDINLNDLLNDAISGKINNEQIYKKAISLFGKEVKQTLTIVVVIIAIILINSILKSISDNFENQSISKIVYYVQYILIVTVIMINISDVIVLVKDTTANLVGFMNLLVPLLTTLMLYTGSITTSSVLEPTILFMVNFLGNIIQNILIPLVLIVTSFCVISKISSYVQINKITKFIKSGVVATLGVLLTLFVAVISLEGTLSSSVDGITAKTTKAVVSSAIPVVGKVLGDAVDTVLGCSLILKNAIGVIGIIIVIGICVVPIIKLTVITISYKLLSAISEPIADTQVVDLLEQIGDIFKIFLAILFSISMMIIIGTAVVIKMSNAGMMYR